MKLLAENTSWIGTELCCAVCAVFSAAAKLRFISHIHLEIHTPTGDEEMESSHKRNTLTHSCIRAHLNAHMYASLKVKREKYSHRKQNALSQYWAVTNTFKPSRSTVNIRGVLDLTVPHHRANKYIHTHSESRNGSHSNLKENSH